MRGIWLDRYHNSGGGICALTDYCHCYNDTYRWLVRLQPYGLPLPVVTRIPYMFLHNERVCSEKIDADVSRSVQVLYGLYSYSSAINITSCK